MMSLKLRVLAALGGLAVLVGLWIGFLKWKSGIEAAAFARGETTERAAWTTKVAKRDAEILRIKGELATSSALLAAAQSDFETALVTAETAALKALSIRDQTILKLKGELNARPILDTPAAREPIPAGRLSIHARADQELADNRRRYRDAAGPSEPNTAPARAVSIGDAALVDADGLTLGGAEHRAAVLAVALAATEGRYAALWDWANAQYSADLTLWQAEQARIADVQSRAPPD